MGDYRNSPNGFGNLGNVATEGFEFGELEYFGDRDVFEIVLVNGLQYTLEQRGSATGDGSLLDSRLYLVDFNDNYLTDDDDSGIEANSLITYTARSTGSFYLSARAYSDNYTGDYTLYVSAGRGTNGADVVSGSNFGDAIEGLGGADNVRGNGGNDFLYGGDGGDTLRGDAGDDLLDGGQSSDTLRGQAGNDNMSGALGADILIGGSGGDVFFYRDTAGSVPGGRDQFRAGDGGAAFDGAGNGGGDRFDLVSIDANTTLGGNQAFVFGGTTQMGKGRVWVATSGSDTIIRANTDNDAAAEWEVEIEDGGGVLASAYTAADFFL